jgi:hypothetical protein
MGFVSFITSDTKRSIPNIHSSRVTFHVFMITKDRSIYSEEDYKGYGTFGGMDFFELIAILNKFSSRNEAIEKVFYSDTGFDPERAAKEGLDIPKLVEHLPSRENWKEEWDKLPYPEYCPDQGFFY